MHRIKQNKRLRMNSYSSLPAGSLEVHDVEVGWSFAIFAAKPGLPARRGDRIRTVMPRGVDWQQGYGFQFWRCTHNAYRGDGAGGQLCIVIPDKDAVIAITADTGNFQDEMNAIWDKVYPAFQAETLPVGAAGQEKLKQVIANLKAHPAKKGS